ncbi:MAG: FxDxF family PEP-CTERM protein [Burkholderiaceae bacterium]|nr:FxDxF family PEP-CTERM protein [Burkholderiaceae bacterium]
MKKSLTAIAVCGALFAFAGQANADTWNAGTLTSAASVHTFINPAGTFNDYVNFQIPSLSDLGASAVPLNLTFPGVSFGVTGLTGYLFDALNGVGNQLHTMQGDNATYTFSNLGAGSYSFRFTGDAASGGGGYMVGLSVAAIPEPSEWAMMLAGLGLVGAVAARRRRRA